MDGAGTLREPSVPSSQFCCEPESALKNKVYYQKKKKEKTKLPRSPRLRWASTPEHLSYKARPGEEMS